MFQGKNCGCFSLAEVFLEFITSFSFDRSVLLSVLATKSFEPPIDTFDQLNRAGIPLLRAEPSTMKRLELIANKRK